jgi:hypothetical protein
MASWKQLVLSRMAAESECLSDIVSSTLSEEEFNLDFNDGPGLPYGTPFTIWTTNRVYFPVTHAGLEWVESVARNPDGKPTEHKGY